MNPADEGDHVLRVEVMLAQTEVNPWLRLPGARFVFSRGVVHRLRIAR
jgi:hypothetical protein